MKRKTVLALAVAGVLVAAGAAMFLYYATDLHLPPEYRWGRDGTLKLDLALERTEITVNDSLNYTMTIKNIGKEKVRLYFGYFGAWSRLLDETGHIATYKGPPMAPPPTPDDARFNSMMKVIEPGRSITQDGKFGNYSTGSGLHDIRPGKAYHVTAGYSCHEDRPYPVLPHWMGDLEAGPKYFTVEER